MLSSRSVRIHFPSQIELLAQRAKPQSLTPTNAVSIGTGLLKNPSETVRTECFDTGESRV